VTRDTSGDLTAADVAERGARGLAGSTRRFSLLRSGLTTEGIARETQRQLDTAGSGIRNWPPARVCRGPMQPEGRRQCFFLTRDRVEATPRSR
jgi:hypothetical protein